jgi:hypothetical protein
VNSWNAPTPPTKFENQKKLKKHMNAKASKLSKVKFILCLFDFHNYEIVQMVDEKGKFLYFKRICQCCGKSQKLQKPKEYHPSKYVFR